MTPPDEGRDAQSEVIAARIDVSARLANRIKEAIQSGALVGGDRLPTERELAETHQMSRGAVRGALSLLERDDLIDRRLGSGTFVKAGAIVDASAEMLASLAGPLTQVAEDISPMDLIEVRMILEPAVARAAALKSTPADLRGLRAILAELEKAGSDRGAFATWDQRFHGALAEATRNPLLVWFYKQTAEIRGRAAWLQVQDEKLTASRIAEYNGLHGGIVTAIETRNGDLAEELMRRHMAEARADFVG